jgi:hypothetical protein
MEGNKKKVESSSSSFTSDLFGPKQAAQSASTGIFASIFPPPTQVPRRRFSSSGEYASSPNQRLVNQEWKAKLSDEVSYDATVKYKSSYYQEDREHPCPLSSSIHYGGRDVYSDSPNSQTSGSYPTTFKKDGGEDDSSASRGNWWQGSLYY